MKENVQIMLDKQRLWQRSRKKSSWEEKLRNSLRLRTLALQMRALKGS